ncbi:MAG: sulfatase-like hydrolase/transferase [Pseudomonadota bacterium]
MADRRNILFVIFDQFRADLLSGPLEEAANLPNLQAFRSQATTFLNHFSVTAPCGPARASLFTGQYAMNHRSVRNGTPLRHDIPNLATELRHAGYDPLLFGYTDAAQDPRVLPPDDPRLKSYEETLPGFTEAVRMRLESDVTAWTDDLRRKGYAVPPLDRLYVPSGSKIDDPAFYSAEDSDTAFLTNATIDRLAGEPAGWCATACFIRPHPPFVAPAPYHSMFAASAMPTAASTSDPRGDGAWHPFLAPTQARSPIQSVVDGFPDLPATPEMVARIRALYCGLAAEVDHHFGRLMRWLEGSGQADETLVIVTADHGEMLGDYGLWGKGSFHDAAFHIPLLIRDPARAQSHGREIHAMTESVDVLPTILDLSGAPVPASANGQSLSALLDGAAPTKLQTFSELDFGNPLSPTRQQSALGLASRSANLAVLRTARFRLVHFAADLPPILFDMEGEGECRDISHAPWAAKTMRELTDAMLRHRMLHMESTFAQTLIADGAVRTGAC